MTILDMLYRVVSLQGLIWLVVALPLAGAAINGLIAMLTARSEGAR